MWVIGDQELIMYFVHAMELKMEPYHHNSLAGLAPLKLNVYSYPFSSKK
jgi:hypothetical protein